MQLEASGAEARRRRKSSVSQFWSKHLVGIVFGRAIAISVRDAHQIACRGTARLLRSSKHMALGVLEVRGQAAVPGKTFHREVPRTHV